MVSSKEAIVKLLKRFVLLGLALLLLVACAPTPMQDNIRPHLVSVTPRPVVRPEVIVLQGRYFGAPGENSYVVLGADSSGEGGFRIPDIREWSHNRIVVGAPNGGGIGFALVEVDGVRSNVLPLNR